MRWLLVMLAACTDIPYGSLPAIGQDKVEIKELPQRSARKLDVLLVIDDSPAMAGYRDHLQRSFPNFANVWSTLPGGLPDLHLAVTTTAADGAFHRIATAGGDYLTVTPLVDEPGFANFIGTLPDALAALGDVGATGPAITQPLEAAKRALAQHVSFAREDAMLAIVIITANDDHSPGTLDDYARWFKAVNGDEAQVMMSVIAGSPEAACIYAGASAVPAVRLFGLEQRFPNRFTFTTICQEDLSDGLSFFGGFGEPHIGDPCFESKLVDTDPDRDWVQPACAVEDVQRIGGVDVHVRALPACDASPPPCWSLAFDPVNCTFMDHAMLRISRHEFPAPDTRVIAECVVE